MTAAEFTAAATGIAAVLGAIAALIAAMRTRRVERRARRIHILVNSSMGAQLRLSMVQSRRLAEMTQKPEDELLAKEAETVYLAHIQRQNEVDRLNEQEGSP